MDLLLNIMKTNPQSANFGGKRRMLFTWLTSALLVSLSGCSTTPIPAQTIPDDTIIIYREGDDLMLYNQTPGEYKTQEHSAYYRGNKAIMRRK